MLQVLLWRGPSCNGFVAIEQQFGPLPLDEEMPKRGIIGQGAHKENELFLFLFFLKLTLSKQLPLSLIAGSPVVVFHFNWLEFCIILHGIVLQ